MDGVSGGRTPRGLRVLGGLAVAGAALTAAGVLAAVFARVAVVEPVRAADEGMAPTLELGDRLLAWKWDLGSLRRGDVVVYRSPEPAGGIRVGRVVGLAGDTVEVRDGRLLVGGEPAGSGEGEREVWRGPFCDAGTAARVREAVAGASWEALVDSLPAPSDPSAVGPTTVPPVEVPDAHVYVLGDHRVRAVDSRVFGALPLARVRGVAWVRLGSGSACPVTRRAFLDPV